ncbi:MAG TPA: hypothetical protein VK988_08240 [Acidimicrobiales bacterium]|nr:hypothetical protein [Acidimicrobiales bacterium]
MYNLPNTGIGALLLTIIALINSLLRALGIRSRRFGGLRRLFGR